MKTFNITSVSLLAWLLQSVPVAAADADPLFRDNGLLDITLTGPFSTIDRDREEDREYPGGTLSYVDGGRTVTLAVKYEVRGNFRLRDDICDHAQLWLDLDKDEVAGTLFENQNRIKLLVQCRDGNRYRRLVVREHQVYRMFNVMSDISFRARLVNVTFRDSERDERRTQIGALLENRDRLAVRIGMDTVERNRISYLDLDPVQANLVDMFMFMVANTDYSIVSAEDDECCHNAKLFQVRGQDTFYPAPYDFDNAGYVDAPYAEPNASLRLRSVRQRLYRGLCVTDAVLDNTLAAFRDKRQRILAIAGDTTLVGARTAADSTDYVEDFYAIIDDPRKVQRDIVDDCRGDTVQ